MKKLRRKNFTLIEVVIVIIILVTLASIATPMYFRQVNKTRVGAAKSQISLFEQAIEDYRVENNKLPSELKDLIEDPGDAETWNGPYIKGSVVPKDPWGNEYIYTVEDDKKYQILSYGADGEPGGEKENADISNIELTGNE